MITPIIEDRRLVSLDLTVDTLPGLRLTIEADAARELRDALVAILGEVGGK